MARPGVLFHQITCVGRQSLQQTFRKVFTITETVPNRVFSCLKVLTIAFTFNTLLRHYAKAKRELTHGKLTLNWDIGSKVFRVGQHSVVLVGAFNQEMALVGAFSVIVKLCEDSLTALAGRGRTRGSLQSVHAPCNRILTAPKMITIIKQIGKYFSSRGKQL